MKIWYEAKDGKLFDTEQECKQYETEYLAFIERVKSTLKHADSIIDFCKSMEYCEECPFLDEVTGYCKFNACSPLDWEIN